MNTIDDARWQAGEKITSLEILPCTHSLIKSCILSAVLWRPISFDTRERLICAFRLRGDA
jgi:hypothetical protein